MTTTTTTTGGRWRRPGLVWPIILIYAGVILLLSNMGYLRADWWELWRLWPLILVAIGLDILSRHSRVASLAVAVAMLAALGGLTYYVMANPARVRPIAGTDAMGELAVSQDLSGAQSLSVRLEMGAGHLRVSALSGGSTRAVEGTLAYPERWQAPSVDYRLQGQVGDLWVRSSGRNWSGHFWGTNKGEDWNLWLSPQVPLRLTVNTGASESELDLRGLNLQELRVSGGVGRLKVLLPAEGGDMTVRIDGGVGEVLLVVPESVAAQIRIEGGLGGATVASRFAKVGEGEYRSAGYETASTRVNVRIEGGLGTVQVQ
ncbi:MAG: LiaI-LiaF-like domain-containing protein [Anaerolineae bacterium]